jgi:DNA-directed RNA polymerase subunit M/transcription elongation factor TFIIS
MKCPKCSSKKLRFAEEQTVASDHSYIDVIANCDECGAELNAYYRLIEITEDPF